jgi:ubiquinone/menaquinone biosynthesis C-methylase UbiE
MSTAPFKDYFSTQASNYARFRPHYPDALFEVVAGLARGHDTAWDCATGNGQVAIGLTPYFQKIYATDASADQIAHAFPHEQIEYRVALAEQSGLPDCSIDLVTVGLALHWLDLDPFYAEVHRVLRPGGAIAVWCTDVPVLPSAPSGLRQAVLQFYEAIDAHKPPEVDLVSDRYQTIPFPFEEVVTPEFNRVADWSVDNLLGYFTTWSATTQLREQLGDGAISELFDAIRAQWGTTDVRRVQWLISMRAGYKTANG